MEFIQECVAELEALDVPQTKRPDFDAFWECACRRVADTPLNVRGETVDNPMPGVEVRDLCFDGLDGTPVRAWLLLPPSRGERVPAVVFYHGATGSRGLPHNYAHWLAMGAAVVAHDFRMQGGLTGSNTGFASGAGQPTLSTLGLLDPGGYYQYHALTDALRACRLALEAPEIDPERVCLSGGSQGGGTSLAVAALEPSVALCLADVPSACWFEKRLWDRTGGYGNIAAFLQRHPDRVEAVCDTLSYFDNINLCDRIRCPVLVSVGLKDPVCPPQNVYAAVNKISAPKEVVPYPFGEHGGGGDLHEQRKLAFFRRHLLRG